MNSTCGTAMKSFKSRESSAAPNGAYPLVLPGFVIIFSTVIGDAGDENRLSVLDSVSIFEVFHRIEFAVCPDAVGVPPFNEPQS